MQCFVLVTVLGWIGCVPVLVEEPVGEEVERSQIEPYLGLWAHQDGRAVLAYDGENDLVLTVTDWEGEWDVDEVMPVRVTQVGGAQLVWLYDEKLSGYVFGRVADGDGGVAILPPDVRWIREAIEDGVLSGTEADDAIRLESDNLESVLGEKAFWHLDHAVLIKGPAPASRSSEETE